MIKLLKKIIDYFRNSINKSIYQFPYDKCYKSMENIGLAVFGNCGENLLGCEDCPYHISKDKSKGKHYE